MIASQNPHWWYSYRLWKCNVKIVGLSNCEWRKYSFLSRNLTCPVRPSCVWTHMLPTIDVSSLRHPELGLETIAADLLSLWQFESQVELAIAGAHLFLDFYRFQPERDKTSWPTVSPNLWCLYHFSKRNYTIWLLSEGLRIQRVHDSP